MKRAEFSKETRRAALQRSGGYCEAIGKAYGFVPGERCNAPLSYGVQFDHYPIRATDGGPATLENCVAVCLKCHRWKTAKLDLPQIAKGKRLQEKRWSLNSKRDTFPTNRNGPFRKRMNGEVERR